MHCWIRSFNSFEDQIIAVADYIIGRLNDDHGLLTFISKNLSWGIFKTAFENTLPDESLQFYDYIFEQMKKIHMIDNETLDTMLWKKVPRIKLELNFAQIKAIADLFAHIVDYKSPFTSNHSMGVAEGAEKISRFMGFDKDICQKMYIAGALHDIGKVAIGNEILEKPEKLTDEEFKTMKHHAVL